MSPAMRSRCWEIGSGARPSESRPGQREAGASIRNGRAHPDYACRSARTQCQLAETRSNLDAALRLAEELGDSELQMRALNALGVHCHHLSRWPEAKGHYERALELARSLKDRHMEGGLLGNIGGVGYDMGDLEAAQADYEESLRVAIEMGDRMWEGNARSNLGLIYQERGRRTEAREQFETALEMARRVGHVQLEYTVHCNLGILLAGEGRFEEAGIHLQRAVDAAIASSDRRAEGQFRGYLALNLARLGRFSEATASLDIGERLLSGISDQLSLALLQCDRAEVDIHRRDLAGHVMRSMRRVGLRMCCSASPIRIFATGSWTSPADSRMLERTVATRVPVNATCC